jgi:phosphoglycerate dehydrogenase-like enzyme
MPNVVMTPHTAGASQFRAQRNMDRFVNNLERMMNHDELEGVIDKVRGY